MIWMVENPAHTVSICRAHFNCPVFSINTTALNEGRALTVTIVRVGGAVFLGPIIARQMFGAVIYAWVSAKQIL